MKGEQQFEVRKDPLPIKSKSKAISGSKGEKADLPYDPNSEELWEKLRSLRLEMARKQSIAPFIIFHDSTLREMIKQLPRTLKEMRHISGIGERKLELYGEEFLAVILDHLREQAFQ